MPPWRNKVGKGVKSLKGNMYECYQSPRNRSRYHFGESDHCCNYGLVSDCVCMIWDSTHWMFLSG